MCCSPIEGNTNNARQRTTTGECSLVQMHSPFRPGYGALCSSERGREREREREGASEHKTGFLSSLLTETHINLEPSCRNGCADLTCSHFTVWDQCAPCHSIATLAHCQANRFYTKAIQYDTLLRATTWQARDEPPEKRPQDPMPFCATLCYAMLACTTLLNTMPYALQHIGLRNAEVVSRFYFTVFNSSSRAASRSKWPSCLSGPRALRAAAAETKPARRRPPGSARAVRLCYDIASEIRV